MHIIDHEPSVGARRLPNIRQPADGDALRWRTPRPANPGRLPSSIAASDPATTDYQAFSLPPARARCSAVGLDDRAP